MRQGVAVLNSSPICTFWSKLTVDSKGSDRSNYWSCHVRDIPDPIILEAEVVLISNSRVANHFSTIGYLIPIMLLFVVPVFPQARFLQNLVVTMVRSDSASEG